MVESCADGKAVGTECRRRHLTSCADGFLCPDGGRRDRTSVPTAVSVPTDLSTAGPGSPLCRRCLLYTSDAADE